MNHLHAYDDLQCFVVGSSLENIIRYLYFIERGIYAQSSVFGYFERFSNKEAGNGNLRCVISLPTLSFLASSSFKSLWVVTPSTILVVMSVRFP